MSGQTAYVRSARMSSRSLSTSYKMATPWLGWPTSYASGYIRHQRTSQDAQSLTTEFSSPPTYWMGLETRASSGSSRGNSDSGTSVVMLMVAQPNRGGQFAPYSQGCLPAQWTSRLAMYQVCPPSLLAW